MPEPRNRVIYVGFGTYRNGTPPPFGGFLSGTRMVVESPLFDHTEFYLNPYTHKLEGGYVRRFIEDHRRIREALREHPDHPIVLMQIGQYASTYREAMMGRIVKRAGRRLILDIRAGAVMDFLERDANALQHRLFRRLVGSCDLALVQCQSFVPELERRYPGVRFEWFPNFMPEARVVRRPPPVWSEGPLRLVFFGWFIPEKGVVEMIEAVTRCRRRGIDIELHLAGRGDDPKILGAIEAADPAVVRNHGFLEPPRLFELLHDMHVLLYPTRHYGEGHTNAVNEALAHGLVVVATPFKELPWVLPKNGTRWLDPERIVDSLEEEILLLAGQPDLVSRLSSDNQDFLLEKYTDTRWIAFLEREFDELSRGA